MGIEVMLYLYGAVCISMLGFNIVYNLILKRSKPRLDKRCRILEARTQVQLERLRRNQKVEATHLTYLQHRLRRVKNLYAFDQVLKRILQEEKEPLAAAYLMQIQPVILYLALVYRKRNNIDAAYFSYFLSRYMAPKHMPIHSIQGVLLDYMRKENLYCRVNALQALYRFASVENILQALRIQDQGEVFIHEKILTEGLLTFTGEYHELIEVLWSHLGEFTERTQLAISNYIRFQTGDYVQKMLAVLQDETWGKELRLSAIRYFGRYYYPPALEKLLEFVRQRDPEQWEYATVSASALARYPGDQVIGALKQALHSGNWYVRYAAAASLEALQVDYADLVDVIAGNDRFAREMMLYRLESRKIEKAGVS